MKWGWEEGGKLTPHPEKTSLKNPSLIRVNTHMNLFSFTPDIKLNTFTFIFFTLSGTSTLGYGLSTVLQLLPHLLTLIINE